MEEKFLEEMQMLLEEKKELCEQSERISKKYSNYGLLPICSMILMEYFRIFMKVIKRAIKE